MTSRLYTLLLRLSGYSRAEARDLIADDNVTLWICFKRLIGR